MGLSFKIAGANFTNFFTSLTLPSRSGLVAEYVFGKDATQSTRNRAASVTPATVIGTPVYDPNFVTVAATNSAGATHGYDTGIAPTADCSIICICTTGGLMGPVLHAGLGPQATGLYNAAGVFSFSNGYTHGAVDEAFVPFTPPAADTNLFFFQAGVGRIGSPGRLYVYKDGIAVIDDATRTDAIRTTDTLKIAGVTNANFTNSGLKVAYGAVFNRLLTQSEVAGIYAQLKAYYSGKIVIS